MLSEYRLSFNNLMYNAFSSLDEGVYNDLVLHRVVMYDQTPPQRFGQSRDGFINKPPILHILQVVTFYRG